MSISQEIFRNYDIRGEYPNLVNEEAAYAIGRAFVVFKGVTHVAVGGDMRISTDSLKRELIRGITDQGADVTDIGLIPTDGVYFAAHYYDKFDGAVTVTASHMPSQFNGFKFLDSECSPIGAGTGMEELSEITRKGEFPNVSRPGKMDHFDIWDDYKKFVLSFVQIENIKPFKVVMDAGNGMGGFVVEKVYTDLPLEITPMYFEPDGSFPNHPANPILPENREDLINKVIEEKADLGVAWDGDCDRVYFVDENGKYVDGDFVTVLMGKYILSSNPGAGIVYDVRASHAVKELLEADGGKTYPERIGHTYIQQRMKEEDAVFGGEVSGHYYFKKNAYAENGFVTPLMIMELMSVEGKSLAQLVEGLGDYYVSGEINSEVKSTEAVIKKLEELYSDAKLDYTDGITVEYPDWHFNVRHSSNEPVIRLNLEARSEKEMEEKRDEVLAIIRSL